ncbi:hypothetical protein CYMTET_30054 [Cymbomonas tetramitiformis]|uniref:Right handed beta helix domain-containing protein n=1 Tax=Cymbomonas tetramitiformis TaxID=36881 RepID=A0AAE0FJK2_9CHLO|nr:hypothetical protein CYMTET_30054 [Cymbomonas tetramitiformis]
MIVEDCLFFNNTARYSGGGAMFSGMELHAFQRNNFWQNHAGEYGGGVCFHGMAATLEEVVVYRCASTFGGGLMANKGSAIAVYRSQFDSNYADSIGGGLAIKQANMTISMSDIRSNRAGCGGGVGALSLANVSVTDTVLSANLAIDDGGGMYVAKCADTVDLISVVSNGSWADRGGALFFEWPHNASSYTLRGFQFGAENAATLGPHAFWNADNSTHIKCGDYPERPVELVELQCEDCAWVNSSALMVTTAVSFAVFQDGEKVTSVLPLRGGAAIEGPLVYAALLRNLANLVVDPLVLVTVGGEAGADDVVLGGEALLPYTRDVGARFSSLTAVSTPGSFVDIDFMPEEDVWATVSVRLKLALCDYGEVYNAEYHTCIPCEPGSIKFDNGTADCSSCEGRPLECHGSNNFTLDDGWWMALSSIAAKCGESSEDSAECVFARIYECDIPEACESPTSGRTALYEGGSSYPVTADDKLCADGYDHDVALCGQCGAGYEQTLDKACRRCKGAIWTGMLILVCILVGLFGIGCVLWRLYKTQMEAWARRLANKESANIRLSKAGEVQGLLGAFANHIQVMSQHVILLETGAIPDFFRGFLQELAQVAQINLSAIQWTGLQCWIAGSTDGESFHATTGVGHFYLNFILLAPVPYFILLPILFSMLRNWKWRCTSSQCEGAESSDGDSVAGCEEEDWKGNPIFQAASSRRSLSLSSLRRASQRMSPDDDQQRASGDEGADDALVKTEIEGPLGEREGTKKEMMLPFRSLSLVAPRTAKLKISETLSAYIICATFALVYVHPTVSTICFNALYCDAIYLDTAQVQYWLNADRGIECFTLQWYIFVTVAFFIIVTYVLGMPLGLIVLTSYLHNQKQVQFCGEKAYVDSSLIQVEKREGAAGDEGNADVDSLGSTNTGAVSELHFRVQHPVTGAILPVDPIFQPHVQVGSSVGDIQTRLEDGEVLQYIGGYMISFKPHFYYWMGYEMLVRFFQTSVVIMVRIVDKRRSPC